MPRRKKPDASKARVKLPLARKGVPPVAVRGRPPRLAHLLPDSHNNKRRERALAALTGPVPSTGPSPATIEAAAMPPGGGEAAAGPDILALPNPEWLPQLLTVIGPVSDVQAFQEAARGSGHLAWSCDYDRAAEDWALQLMTLPPARRGISVAGARILAEDLRDRVERLDMAAVDGATDLTCPLDLNALVPLPSRLLRLGPDDPAVVDWQWAHWGTTWMLRGVDEVPVGRAGVLIPDGHGAVCFRFWSADWTPWRALETVRSRWPALSIHVKLMAVTE